MFFGEVCVAIFRDKCAVPIPYRYCFILFVREAYPRPLKNYMFFFNNLHLETTLSRNYLVPGAGAVKAEPLKTREHRSKVDQRWKMVLHATFELPGRSRKGMAILFKIVEALATR